MPAMEVEEGWECRVSMIAHGGWYLAQHVQEPEVRFNILYGGYDYVVLQEHAHPFGPTDKFLNAAIKLNEMIRKSWLFFLFVRVATRVFEPFENFCFSRSCARLSEIGS